MFTYSVDFNKGINWMKDLLIFIPDVLLYWDAYTVDFLEIQFM